MSIYILALKNLRRNRMRNFSTITGVTVGVLVLLILVGSGLGVTSFLDRLESVNNVNQSSGDSSSINITQYISSTLGINLEQNQAANVIINLIQSLILFADGIASLALVIGVIGVYTAMFFNELERRRDVGLFKIMGFSEKQILLTFALEGTILGLISSAVGVILGSLGLFLLTQIFGSNLGLLLPGWLILMTITLTTGLSFILSLYPSFIASKNGFKEVFNPV
ncbi:MAG: ABC-type transport system, involved in lipoprotein release, permease component [Methanobacterium sp. Maddingley MBC34]|nr:MAG: ABC-type transport system, involved in lipoprotein release, permease component [Methanobacterium sp. Maddingley MBC34]